MFYFEFFLLPFFSTKITTTKSEGGKNTGKRLKIFPVLTKFYTALKLPQLVFFLQEKFSTALTTTKSQAWKKTLEKGFPFVGLLSKILHCIHYHKFRSWKESGDSFSNIKIPFFLNFEIRMIQSREIDLRRFWCEIRNSSNFAEFNSRIQDSRSCRQNLKFGFEIWAEFVESANLKIRN